jgi:hypothetical protein
VLKYKKLLFIFLGVVDEESRLVGGMYAAPE